MLTYDFRLPPGPRTKGGTALPICRKAGFIVPQNRKPSGNDCSRAASLTEIVRA
jgi:hypothetical protein